MADVVHHRRDHQRGGRRSGNFHQQSNNSHSRKRGRDDDGDEHDRDRRRRRYEQPVAARLRAEILKLADGPSPNLSDDCGAIGRDIAMNFDDDQVRGDLLDIILQLLLEQPVKIPHVAAVFLYANDANAAASKGMIARVAIEFQDAIDAGSWGKVKLLLRFLACLQGILQDGGIMHLLDQLFDLAADFQAASSADCVGFEIVKIILLTLPYALAAYSSGEERQALEKRASELLEKTEIITSAALDNDPAGAASEEGEEHLLKQAVNPFPLDNGSRPFGYQSSVALLQEQSKRESTSGWPAACIPRLYKSAASTAEQDTAISNRQELPVIKLAYPANPGEKAHFPETFFSMYANQDIETVPRTNNIACSLLRDVAVDTVNLMDFNRTAVARLLIEFDGYWNPGTFTTRAMAVDKLKDVPVGQPTWKAEDIIVDAVFAQIFMLPRPPHKLVYYHSIVTELCRQSAGSIAPCLGRAMRWLFRGLDAMDLELNYRFIDWFSHHLSNFEFRWKWDEWTPFLELSNLHPKKSFVVGALDKEIRLSFARRVRDTLPKAYHPLITEGKEKDVPDFKYKSEMTAFAKEGSAIQSLLRKRAPEEDVQKVIDAIHGKATEQGLPDPTMASTDAFMTSVCYIGSKSLSHVLSCVERNKDRLIKIGQDSEAGRRQIIQSVFNYWEDQPGVAVNIVDKLLNYTIVTPESVIVWALGPENIGDGSVLSQYWRFELVAVTVFKVTNRVRQIVDHKIRVGPTLSEEQIQKIDEVLIKERDEQMAQLFTLISDFVRPVADGASDGLLRISLDLTPEDLDLVKGWGQRWLKVFERTRLVEKCVVGAGAVTTQAFVANLLRELNARREKAQAETDERKAAERAARVEAEEAARISKAEAETAKLTISNAANAPKATNGSSVEAVGLEADMNDDLDVAPDNDV